MIWPDTRLLWAAALILLPLFALGGALSFLTLPCAAILTFCFAVAAVDALAFIRQSGTWRVASAAENLQWFKDRAGTIPLTLTGGGSHGQTELLVWLKLPPELQAAEPFQKIQPGGTEKLDIRCLPKQRGRYKITDCFLSGGSPLKLWRNKTKQAIYIEIRVYPDLRHDSAARTLMLRRSAGARRLRLVGRGRDFERLREYAPGDSFDEVYWKATARRGAPIVKVFQAERTQDVYAIIDSSHFSARRHALDLFINAALTVALATETEGDNFGLVAFSHHVERFIRAGRGKAHFGRCREALYDLSAGAAPPDLEDLFGQLQLQIRKRSLLLFLTDLSDPMLQEAFLRDAPLLARKHVLVVNQLEDEESRPLFSGVAPSNIDEIGARLAGHLQWAKLQDLGRSLRQRGVGMRCLPAESVSAGLLQQYWEIKQKQAL